jgi:hypothetical protein
MPINSTKPTIRNGETYPHFAVQMIVSPGIEIADISARVVINLTPYRVRGDNTIDALTGPENMKSVLISDAFVRAQTDPALAEALGTIMYAVQNYIAAKEL